MGHKIAECLMFTDDTIDNTSDGVAFQAHIGLLEAF